MEGNPKDCESVREWERSTLEYLLDLHQPPPGPAWLRRLAFWPMVCLVAMAVPFLIALFVTSRSFRDLVKSEVEREGRKSQ